MNDYTFRLSLLVVACYAILAVLTGSGMASGMDSDGDGFSDCEELEAGSNPLDPSSFPFDPLPPPTLPNHNFKIQFSTTPSLSVALTWDSQPDVVYAIDFAESFANGWEEVKRILGPADTTRASFESSTLLTGRKSGFFRVRVIE